MRTSRYLQTLPSVIGGLILISSFLSATTSEAATFYVATTGDDDNPGIQALPWRTLQKGMDASGPGDTILVRAGTYAGFRLINTGGGSAGAEKTIKPYPGEVVTLDRDITPEVSWSSGGKSVIYFEGAGASYVIVDGFRITDTGGAHPGYGEPGTSGGGTNQSVCNAWSAYAFGKDGIRFDWHSALYDNPHHITIQNVEIDNMQVTGLWGDVDNLQLLNSHIHHNGRRDQGWYTGGYGTYIQGNTHLVRGNNVHDNVSVGLRFACQAPGCELTNSIIENNLVYNNYGKMAHYGGTSSCNAEGGGYGIIIWSGAGNIVRNNIVYGNTLNESWGDVTQQWGIMVLANNGPNEIYNNTVYNHNGPGSIGIFLLDEGEAEASGGNVIQNNISYLNGFDLLPGEGNVERHNLVGVDPKFVDASAGDFHLQADSAAIDAGVEIGEDSVDYDGIARPQGTGYDIGALEYTSD